MMNRSFFAIAPFLSAVALLGQKPNAADFWPQAVDDRGFHLVIYQPQIDSWKNNRLEARAAVTAKRDDSSQEMFGIVKLSARTEVDRQTRIVWLEDRKIESATFPGAKPEQGDIEKAVRDSLPNWPGSISLDRLLADLSMMGAEAEAQNTALKN